MGNDVADYNNDGLLDLVAVDMLPPDNKRQKLMFGATSYDRYQSEVRTGYAPQYMRNTLQLNRGSADHRIEAEALYRSAATVDSLTRAAAALATKATVASVEIASATSRAADAKADARAATAETRDQDAEIQRLQDELAKSKDELERIKKRLAETTKKPPGE